MSLTKVATLIRKHLRTAVIILMVIVILGLIYGTGNKPPSNSQLPKIEAPNLIGATLNNVSVKADLTGSTPPNLEVFFSPSVLMNTDNLSQIASELGFNQTPTIDQDKKAGQIYFWSGDRGTLMIEPEIGRLRYKLYISPKSAFIKKTAPDSDTAIAAAKEFILSKSFTPKDIMEKKELTTYLKNTGFVSVPVSNPTEANLVKVSFVSQLNNLDLVTSGDITSTVEILVANGGQIISMEGQFTTTPESGTSYPIKDLQTAITDLNAKGIAVYQERTAQTAEAQGIPLKSVTLTSSRLGYYLAPEKQNYIEPIYIFEGTYTDDNNNVLKAVVYESAVEDNLIAANQGE